MYIEEAEIRIARLKERFAGCEVLLHLVPAPGSETVCGELIVEKARKADGAAYVVLDRSTPHFHLQGREVYQIVKGQVAIICNGAMQVILVAVDLPPPCIDLGGMQVRGTCTIQAGMVHQAVSLGGEPAEMWVKSIPGWSADDHFEL